MQCASCGKPTQPGAPCASCGAPADSWAGRVLGGRYLVKQKIGAGGNSTVYQARDEQTQQDVAIKILRQDATENRDAVERFKREISILQQLQHPGIVNIIAHGEEGSSLWLAMELLIGETLDDRLKSNSAMTLEALLAMLAPLCEALQLAHDKQIYHRDLKPQNIFITKGGYKLLDFGMATLQGEEALTRSEVVSGTPKYMAPEQWDGLKHADARSDVYALAFISYRCLSGVFPFEADSPISWMKKHTSEPPLDLKDAMHGRPLPDALYHGVMKALSKAPAERPPNALAFLESLRPKGVNDPSMVLAPTKKKISRRTLLLGGSIIGAGTLAYFALRPRELSKIVCPSIHQNYMPLKLGNWWEYKVSDPSTQREEGVKRITLDKYQDIGGRYPGVFAFRLYRTDNNGSAIRWIREVEGRTVWVQDEWFNVENQLTSGRYYSVGRLRIDQRCERLEPGVTWQEEYEMVTINYKENTKKETHEIEVWKVEAINEEIKTEKGPFSCIRVRREKMSTGRSDSTYWFAQGIGKVKEESPPKELEIMTDYHLE